MAHFYKNSFHLFHGSLLLFQKTSMDKYEAIQKWAELNKKLEASWTPLHQLVAERDEIEKVLPWLKGHGASPFPPKAAPPPPPQDQQPPPPVAPPKQKQLKERERKKPKNTEAMIRAMEVMKSSGPPASSPSTVPLNQDTTQNF